MTDAGSVMSTIRIQQGTGGSKKEQVVFGARVRDPKVPRPRVGQLEHAQPLTPDAAMLLMNDRWKATNITMTGMVIIDAYAMICPQEMLS